MKFTLMTIMESIFNPSYSTGIYTSNYRGIRAGCIRQAFDLYRKLLFVQMTDTQPLRYDASYKAYEHTAHERSYVIKEN